MVTFTVSALTHTTMMASVLLRSRNEQEKRELPASGGMEGRRRKPSLKQRFSRAFNRRFESIEQGYGRVVRRFLEYRKSVAAGALALFIISLLLVPLIGTEFMPVSDNNQLQLEVELATGRSLDFTAGVIAQLEEIIDEEVPELRNMSIRAGRTGFGGGVEPAHVVTGSRQRVKQSHRERAGS